jgi:DNA-binding GntR family transcriptional regulator
MRPMKEITLRDAAFQQIKQAIVNGQWEGGTFLSERMLSELLQMSKTPIRSALDRLEMMGLVKLVPNQGFVVQEISMKKIMDIYELRLSLETFAANHLTGKMDRVYFDKLDANIAKQSEAVRDEDIVSYVELDRQFHETIISGMANTEYTEAMSRIQDKFLMAVRTTFYKNKKRLSGSLDEHKQIREALEGVDPLVTVELVKKHIKFVEQIMF